MLSAKKIQAVAAVAIGLGVAPLMLFAGCATDGGGEVAPEESEPVPGTETETGEGICLMNNCTDDEQCAGCADDRNTCLPDENRCVACNPVTGQGCEPGFACSPFGICAPEGQICPTDDHGTPQVTCSENADCLACSPMHQVCDTATGQCQACTGTNTQHCLASDICVDGSCSPKCPSSCTVDNDCGQCGAPGNEAHACNAHVCSECSDTWPCEAGLECVAGSCVPGCGATGGQTSGSCLSDEDCAFCGDPDDPTSGSWDCKKPVNANGPNDHGTCGPVAAGCSDLGTSVAVLPEPWSDYTNLCSSDNDCAGVGIQLDVGELVKDLVGSDQIDLGFTKVDIQSATVSYDMSTCADVDITADISCGVCVPCKVDNDCQPIAVDPVINDMFAGEPLAQIAGALLINLLYGNESEHNLNFYCQPVAAGYGVCAPCSNPLQACGSNQGIGSGGGSGGSCDHDTSTTGGPLNSSCSTCAATVCQSDSYCCDVAWDSVCVGAAAQLCGSSGGGGGGSCSHSECTEGAALTTGCSSCVDTVCGADPFCCNNNWDGICVQKAEDMCGNTCNGGSNPPVQNGCVHPECSTGVKLDPSCSSCATSVCNADSYCCDVTWDSICVDAANTLCGGCN